MTLLRMAWRNLWRNARRSVVTTAAMTLALWVMVLYSGLLEGYWRGMERDILDLEVGDVQIHARGYLDDPSLHTRIERPGALLARLDGAGYAASARLLAGGLAAVGEQSAGVSLRGVDADRDAQVLEVHTAIAAGQWLDPHQPQGVVIGRRLAKTLGARVGSELVVVSQGADGSMANDLFQVRGVLKTIADGTDRSAVFMHASAFRELMVLPQGVHQVIVRRPAAVDLARAVVEVGGLAPGLDARSWRQLMPTIAMMLDSSRSMIFVVFCTVYLAVAILVLNAMLMAVFERIRELGVLKALGYGPARVLGLILLESGMQTGLAVVVGLVATVPGIYYLTHVGINVGKLGGASVMGLAMPPIWYGSFSTATLAGPVIMLVMMVLLGALYPALKAAWVRPVQAMHHV